ncbi:hypothetical protein HD806DRAFT_518455 [Xylariaceae sp. AK1471]|nr:hypothetical protein HD806DRAFT_518455 [Xylariaceae sp. AK1471]
MRLLNTTTLKLEEFVVSRPVNGDSDWSQKKGADKVRKSCEVAKSKGYEWIWIDTCCIDKSSSAELSESINSMFKWYEDSAELIAPSSVEFYDRDWVFIDTRFSLSKLLANITGIDELVLRHGHQLGISSKEHNRRRAMPQQYCCSCPYAKRPIRDLLNTYGIANIMSWASQRRTTRSEDIAYCMFGLFNVNMPLLYGEGGEEAFLRLQKSIFQKSDDQSILAWDIYQPTHRPLVSLSSTFAPSPYSFFDGGKIHPSWTTNNSSNTQRHKMKLSEEGLAVTLLLCPCHFPSLRSDCYMGFLDCGIKGDPLSRLAILLTKQPGSTHFVRANSNLYRLTPDLPTRLVNLTLYWQLDEDLVVNTSETRMESIYLPERDTAVLHQPFAPTLRIGNIVDQDSEKCSVEYIYPTIEDIRSWNVLFGLIFLYKPGYQRFLIYWAPVQQVLPVTSQTQYQLRLSLLPDNVHPGKNITELIRELEIDGASHRYNSNPMVPNDPVSLLSLAKLSYTLDSMILAGPPQRKITARITDRTFIGRSVPELTVEVTPVTEAGQTPTTHQSGKHPLLRRRGR